MEGAYNNDAVPLQPRPSARPRGRRRRRRGANAGTPAAAAVRTDKVCDNSAFTQTFSQWDDANRYKIVPRGSVENGA
jgi:hypothetical protein